MKIGGTNVIDFARVSSIPKFVVNVKAGDSKRKISLALLENNTAINLNNYTVVIACKKSDGNDILNSVTITDSINGLCEVEISKQMLALGTDLPCEIVLYGKDGSVSTSSNFVISRLASIRDEKNIVSTSEFTVLTNALSKVANFDSRITEIENKGTTVEVLERVTKEEINRQIADGTIANLTLLDNSVTGSKIKDGEITGNKLSDHCIDSRHISDNLFAGGQYFHFKYRPKENQVAQSSFLMLGIENPYPGRVVTVDIQFNVTCSKERNISVGAGGLDSITNPGFDLLGGWKPGKSFYVGENLKTNIKHTLTCSSNEDYPHIAIGLVVPNTEIADYDVRVEDIKINVTYSEVTTEADVSCAGFHNAITRYEVYNIDVNLAQDYRFIEGVRNIINTTPPKDNSVKFEYLEADVPLKVSEVIFGKVEPVDFYKPNIDEFTEKVMGRGTTFIIAKPIPTKCFIDNIKFGTSTDVRLVLFTKEGNYFTPYAIYDIPMEQAIKGSYNPIEVTENNTYIGINGLIAYQSKIDSELNINKMYDFTSTPIIGEQANAKMSGIRIWFDMEIITKKSVNPLYEVESEIKSLNREIEDLRNLIENMNNGGGLSDNPVKNLNTVWDLELGQTNEGWVYSNTTINEGSGVLCKGASKAYYNQYLTFDTYQHKAMVTVNDVNSQFGLICHNSNKGALYLVDGANKRISLHSQYTGGAIPTLKASTDLPFELKEGGNYMLTVVKTGWKHTFTIIDTKTMEECTVEFDNATQASSGSYCGKGWGGPGVVTFTGSVLFKNHKYYVALYPKAKALFIGDSITEGTNMGANVDIKYRWCSLLRDNYFNYDAIICGRGGATSNDILSRMNSLEALNVKSDIVIVLDGTNERSQSAVDNWKVKMPQIREKIISWGAKPIICVPPIPSSGFEYIAQMRDFILEQGWDTIRMDIATSLNGDGVTYDSSLYTDGVHPNKKGGEQMYNRALKDLEIIL